MLLLRYVYVVVNHTLHFVQICSLCPQIATSNLSLGYFEAFIRVDRVG